MQDLDERRLTEPVAARLAPRERRARGLSFDAGRDVCDGVRGRPSPELRFTWLGGTRILDGSTASATNVFMLQAGPRRRWMCRRSYGALLWDIAASGWATRTPAIRTP